METAQPSGTPMSRTWDVFHIWYRNTSFQYRTNLKLKSLSKPQVKYFFFLIGKQQSAEIQSKTTGLSLSQRSQCSKGRAEGRYAWQTGKPGRLLQLQWYWLPARGMDGQALTGLLSPTSPWLCDQSDTMGHGPKLPENQS